MVSWIVGAVLGVSGALGAAIYLVHRALASRVSNDEATAALKSEDARISQMEAAASAARAQRLQEFDARADSVRTAGDAAGLLRDVTHAGDPPPRS